MTGVHGQDGVLLSRFLLDRGYRVIGTVSPGSRGSATYGVYLAGVEVREADIRDVGAMSMLLDIERPDEVYNLASFSSVGASWGAAELVAETNGTAVLRLLEILVRHRDAHGSAPRFYQASSSEIYGLAHQQPQDEGTPHYPRSPYGTSKSFAHHLTVNYRESYGLHASNGVLFNHESPLRPSRFVTRKITRAVAEISLGLRDTVVLGDLDVARDWGSAADYVEAMWLMVQQEEPADYVIATGTATSLREFVSLAFAAVGIDDVARYVTQDPALTRPADVPVTRGDAAKARHDLGWRSTATLPELVARMVEVDLERLRSGVEESTTYLS